MGNQQQAGGSVDDGELQSLMAQHHIPYRSIYAGSSSTSAPDLEQHKSVVETYTPAQHNALGTGLKTSAEHTFTLLRWCCIGFWFCLCTLGLSWIPYFIVKRNQQNPVQPRPDASARSKSSSSVSRYKPHIRVSHTAASAPPTPASDLSLHDNDDDDDDDTTSFDPAPQQRSVYLEI